MSIELEGQLPEYPQQRTYADSLDHEQRQRIVQAAHVIIEQVVSRETVATAVRSVLTLLLKEKKQALMPPKLGMSADQIAIQDTHERGLIFGIQEAFDEITDGNRLSDLIERLTGKD